MAFLRLAIAMSTTLSLAAAQTPETGGGPMEHQARFNNGNSMVLTGTVVAVGGIVAGTMGALFGSPEMLIAGTVGEYAGVSVVGVGAKRVNLAAESLHPSYHGDYRGWGWYWTSLALEAAATVLVVNTIREARRADSEEEELDIAAEGLELALPFSMAAKACLITSWIKFSRLAHEGRQAPCCKAAQLDLQPRLGFGADGTAGSGLLLAYRF